MRNELENVSVLAYTAWDGTPTSAVWVDSRDAVDLDLTLPFGIRRDEAVDLLQCQLAGWPAAISAGVPVAAIVSTLFERFGATGELVWSEPAARQLNFEMYQAYVLRDMAASGTFIAPSDRKARAGEYAALFSMHASTAHFARLNEFFKQLDSRGLTSFTVTKSKLRAAVQCAFLREDWPTAYAILEPRVQAPRIVEAYRKTRGWRER